MFRFISWRVAMTALAAASGFLAAWHSPAAAASICAETRQTSVAVSEFLPPGQPYQSIREIVLRMALIEAVEQALGLEVRARTEITTVIQDDDLAERHVELLHQKSKGLIESYEVVDESLEDNAGSQLLSLRVDARVCVPEERKLPDVVAFGDFLRADGSKDDGLRELAASLFPQSPRFVVADGRPQETYQDIVIKGHVIAQEIHIVDNSRDIEILGRYLSAGAAESLPKRLKRITAKVMTEAVFSADRSRVSEFAEVSRVIAVDGDEAPVLAEMIAAGLAESATNLFKELTSASD